MSKQATKYRALELYLKELDMLFDVYSIPKSAFTEKSIKNRRRVSLVETSWYDKVKGFMDRDIVYHVCRRVDRLIEEVREIRQDFKERGNPDSFDDRVGSYVAKAHRKIRHLFHVNEGGHFDFDVNVGLRHTLPEYLGESGFNFQIYDAATNWHRGRQLKMHRVKVHMTPRNAMAIRDEWFFFKIKSKPQFVMSAEEIKGHMFNNQGVKVYRLDCFGLINDDPQSYQYYVVQNEGLLNDDGVQIFAHGKDVSSAMSLLNRRIKSETIKRLDI